MGGTQLGRQALHSSGGIRPYAIVMLRLTQKVADGPALLLKAEWEMMARELDLSPRELQVVQHVFADEKEQVIAARLGISVHTVHTYLKRIYWKLGVNSRAGLVVRVFREYVAHTRQGKVQPEVLRRLVARRAA